jgi:hypothetical protein
MDALEIIALLALCSVLGALLGWVARGREVGGPVVTLFHEDEGDK